MLLNDARQQIADACSHLSDDGLVVGTAGNLSVRDGDLVAITPSGLPYQEMRPDLVAVVEYATGKQVEGPLKPASELDLHLTALRATGQMSVVHTHSYAATTVASLEGVNALPAVHYYICMFGGSDVRVADYAIYGSPELAANVAKALEGRTAALMSNHGSVVTGPGAGVGLRALSAHARRRQSQDPHRRADRGGRVQDPGHRLRSARPGRGGLSATATGDAACRPGRVFPMTRIVAGTVGGRRIEVPRSGTRPTSERVREALFARLDHYGVLDGARVLDLCAGSGALGLEAASRGAGEVTLVDSSRGASQTCRRNIRSLGLSGVSAVTAKAAAFLAGPAGAPADLVLIDPPYELSEEELTAILTALVRSEDPWLAPRAVVVVERSTRSPEPTWPAGLERFADKRYGETTIWFAEPA